MSHRANLTYWDKCVELSNIDKKKKKSYLAVTKKKKTY